jgi:tetratricopeptide (TPR) repeat protein
MLFVAAGLLARFAVPETNSHAAAARGLKAYEAKQYEDAVTAFRKVRPSPSSAFNLGTAEIAGGHREEGSATLGAAIKDPTLRADALYNRGNSALAAKAFDHAVRDYKDALRARPNFPAAKRNLEIALIRRASAEQEASGKQQGGGGKQEQQNPQQPAPGQKPAPKNGQTDLEALLRSVQQQEQEELARMKRVPAERRVGW